MGYNKVRQYGDTLELYEYENSLSDNRRKYQTENDKRRQNARRNRKKRKGVRNRRSDSIKRSRDNFFALVHANNCDCQTVAFCTLTLTEHVPLKTALQYQSHFFKRLRGSFSGRDLRYISVPERTKKGRIHFHVLLYDLPPKIIDSERTTRIIQAHWGRGYVDLLRADVRGKKLAGYLAKYMFKALNDIDLETWRGYYASRNIRKVQSYASNEADSAVSIFKNRADSRGLLKQSTVYEVPYLGTCVKTVYTGEVISNIENHENH